MTSGRSVPSRQRPARPWHDGVVNETEAIERARQFRSAGLTSAALDVLKERVRRRPVERTARQALAEHYRAMGAPDQAGRWGIAVPGWTTATERDRLARMLAASGVGVEDVNRFLELPVDERPGELAEVLASAETYRTRFAEAIRTRFEPTPTDRWQDAAGILWIVAIGIFVIDLLVIWVGTLLGSTMTGFARWASVAALVVIAAACLMTGTSRMLRGRRVAATWWLVASAVLIAGLARLIAQAVANHGSIVFFWER